jgi:hypothetical protein
MDGTVDEIHFFILFLSHRLTTAITYVGTMRMHLLPRNGQVLYLLAYLHISTNTHICYLLNYKIYYLANYRGKLSHKPRVWSMHKLRNKHRMNISIHLHFR